MNQYDIRNWSVSYVILLVPDLSVIYGGTNRCCLTAANVGLTHTLQ